MSDYQPTEGKLWNLVMSRFAFPLLTFSIGFGGSQMLALAPIREKLAVHETHLSQLDIDVARESQASTQRDVELRRGLDEARTQTEERFKNVVILMQAQVNQISEVIGLFKIQQQVK